MEYAKKIGVKVNDLLISQPDTGEQALEIVETLVRSNGVDIIVTEPVVVMARAALARVPVAGEQWSMSFPIDPDPDTPRAEWGNFILSKARAPEGGRSLGLIRLYPTKAVQTP